MKKQQGISLLELVLSIALITIILVGGMKYFQVARQAGRVNESLLMIKSVYGAAEVWRAKGLKFSDRASPEGAEGATLLAKFAQLGLLTPDYESEKHHPWGGLLEAEGDGDLLKIRLVQLPEKACEDIRSKLESGMSSIKEAICTSDASAVVLNISAEIK